MLAQACKDVENSHGIKMALAALKSLGAKSSLVVEHSMNLFATMMAANGLLNA